MQVIQSIQNRIYEIRGERVLLDFDLAQLYEVETKVLNQAVKRNLKRFPQDFMFRLNVTEWQSVRSQFVTAYEKGEGTWSQIVTTSQDSRRRDSTPYAFTEQGVAMLSGILQSDKAINMNIAIMRAFVEIRKLTLQQNNTAEQLREIVNRLSEHDIQLSSIYDTLENMLDEKAAQKKWEDREKIGFRS